MAGRLIEMLDRYQRKRRWAGFPLGIALGSKGFKVIEVGFDARPEPERD